MMVAKLILIRHGETDLNRQRRYCGFTDIDLNRKGKDQAKNLSIRLNKFCTKLGILRNEEKIHKVYSSDMKRTFHFAKIIFKNMPVKKLSEFREMNFGVFEGMTHQEVLKKYPEIYSNWLSNPFDSAIPKSESLNDFRKRVLKIFKKIASLNDNKTLAIVTHAGPIRMIINDILKPKSIWEMMPDLASINVIEFKRGKASILLLNNTWY